MRRLTICMLFAALTLAGCGGGDKASSSGGSSDTATPTPTATAAAGGGGQNLAISADPSALKFDKSTLSAKAGKVTITMDNPASFPHAVSIEGKGVDVHGKVVQKGGKSVASADLNPGTYTFYCQVDKHRQAGMEGKLTVK